MEVVVSLTPGCFTSGERDLGTLLDRRLAGPQSQFGHGGKEKKSLLDSLLVTKP
jgi:hypothetical protein